MHKPPEGYVAVAGTTLSAGSDPPADVCSGCAFQHDRAFCPWCGDAGSLLCAVIAKESREHDNIIFQKDPAQAVSEKLDMHLLQHKKLLMALDELVNDYEAHNGGMPTLPKLIDWAEKQARATDHMSLHPGV